MKAKLTIAGDIDLDKVDLKALKKVSPTLAAQTLFDKGTNISVEIEKTKEKSPEPEVAEPEVAEPEVTES